MDHQEEINSINQRLYCVEVQNEPIKKIMFYFTVLKEIIDFPFPENFINYDHPYFTSYEQMENFFSLSRTLDPSFLHQNNVIIFHNEKKYYQYYQRNEDNEGTPYEFNIVDNSESNNPIFNDNYQNVFNISNIDKDQTEFKVKVPYKSSSLHPENEDIPEDDYLNENDLKNENSINGIVDSEYDRPNMHSNDNKKKKKHKHKQKHKKNKRKNHMSSEDELEEDISIEEFQIENVKIKYRLIVTNDWIDFIYNQSQKELLPNMKTAIKKDDIRTKSISLAKNVFFYLEIIMLVLLAACSWGLFSWSTTLKNDKRFSAYKGENNNTKSNNEKNLLFYELNRINVEFKEIFNLLTKNNLYLLDEKIDYKNDTIIVPENKKYNKIKKACKLSEVTSIFTTVFLIFLIYMCIRVAREKKKKYQQSKKAGLNICHFVLFIIIFLITFIIAFVSEIYIFIAISLKTYDFIHVMIRNQIINNSLLFVLYILIVLFYCKI